MGTAHPNQCQASDTPSHTYPRLAMGNGAVFRGGRPAAAAASTVRWPDDLGRIETWQQQVQEASANGNGPGGTQFVDAGGRMGGSSRVPLLHSLSCPDSATEPSLVGPPTGRMVPPCTSQRLHFDSTVKVYCVSSRPNFLQVCASGASLLLLLPFPLPPFLFIPPFPPPSSLSLPFILLPPHSSPQPWQMKAQQVASGSGFVVEGRCILTNAHVVDEYTTVRVRKHGHPMKYNARVLVSGYAPKSPGLLAAILVVTCSASGLLSSLPLSALGTSVTWLCLRCRRRNSGRWGRRRVCVCVCVCVRACVSVCACMRVCVYHHHRHQLSCGGVQIAAGGFPDLPFGFTTQRKCHRFLCKRVALGDQLF